MFLLSPSAIVGTRRRRASRARFGARGWGGIVAASVLLGAPGQVGRAQQAGIPQVAPNALGVTIPDLRAADEAAVSGEWVKLQAELREAETLDPAAAIPLYGQFLDRGGARFDGVALSVVSRVGRLYWADLREFDKALEGYDWAIAAYPNAPDLPRIREERRAVEQEQARQTRRRANRESVPVPPLKIAAPVGGNVPGAAPLVAPITKVGGLPAVAQPVVPPLKFVMPDLAAPATRVVVPPLRLAALDLALPARPGTYAGWTPSEARAVTALARGAGGQVWAATEDAGVWRYDASAPAATRWKQFTAQDGVGDNSAYALATDKQGRMWAGTLNHGVSVWNGKTWRNYGVLEGPLGERVFDIAVCPTDGDVWIATNAGLTRYSVAKDSWSYVTRAEGLPSDQVQALAFDQSGNLVVGTQCEGVAIALAAEGYKNWRVVTGPERMPLTPTGAGLPSNLINDVMVARDGTYYVATTTGLAWSGDAGRSWAFVRGQDYAAKVRGLYGGAPATWTEVAKPGALLAEDYVTSLAEDEQGRLWVGHWNKGSEVLEMRGAGGIKDVVWQEKSGFVKDILALPGAQPLLARYDEGIEQTSSRSVSSILASTAEQGPKPSLNAAFPSAVAPPTLQELRALEIQVATHTKPLEAGQALFLGEDWRTQGDWVGRYGRRKALLCAMGAPFDADFVVRAPFVPIVGQLGPHTRDEDSIRRWIHWVKTDDGRTLYHPQLGYRRQAEWDDHGEVYPFSFEGPDLWTTIEVPAGVHRLSSYFFNKDGESGLNRMRDFTVELRTETKPLPAWPAPETPEQATGQWLQENFGAYYRAREKLIEAQRQTPPLAQTRVRDFRGGVYKQFLVRGPATYWFHIGRNHSYDTIVSAILLDEVGPGQKWSDDVLGVTFGGRYNPPDPDAPEAVDPHLLDKILDGTFAAPRVPTEANKARAALVQGARALWDASDAALAQQGGTNDNWQARVMAYRAAAANDAPAKLLENWRWKMPLWTGADRAQWRADMARNYQHFVDLNPDFKDANF